VDSLGLSAACVKTPMTLLEQLNNLFVDVHVSLISNEGLKAKLTV